jgi:hypothetical protein
MIKGLLLLSSVPALLIHALPPQENVIFQHGEKIINDPNFWEDVTHELQIHGLPSISPKMLMAGGKAALVDVYHEHEADEAAKDAYDANDAEDVDSEHDEEAPTIEIHGRQAMGDVSGSLMSMIGHIFAGPTHPPLPSDMPPMGQSISMPMPMPMPVPLLRDVRGIRGRIPITTTRPPLLPPPSPFFHTMMRPLVPPAPVYKGVPPPHDNAAIARFDRVQGLPPLPKPPMEPNISPELIPPHLPLGAPIRRIASRLPLGRVISAEPLSGSGEGEKQMQEIMDQIVDERRQEKKTQQDEAIRWMKAQKDKNNKINKTNKSDDGSKKGIANKQVEEKQKQKQIKMQKKNVATIVNKKVVVVAHPDTKTDAVIPSGDAKPASEVMKMLKEKAKEKVTNLLNKDKKQKTVASSTTMPAPDFVPI